MIEFGDPPIHVDLAHTAEYIGQIVISRSTIAALKRFEGFSAKAYRDSEGLLTIGYGTLIEYGISREEAELLLVHRLKKSIRELQRRKPFVVTLPLSVRRGLRRMAYNLGVPRLMKFTQYVGLLCDVKTSLAPAAEALDSLWSKQVGPKRSGTIANLIGTAPQCGRTGGMKCSD